MSGQLPIAGDVHTPPTNDGRKSKLFWWLILVVAGGFLLLFFPWPRLGFESYIDRNSGDVMTKKLFGNRCYKTEITETPFSIAVRKYLGPVPPANWVYCNGKVNGAYEEGSAGIWPSDCRLLMQSIQFVRLREDETKAIIQRCAGYLKNDQRKEIEAEGMALFNKADGQDHAGSQP